MPCGRDKRGHVCLLAMLVLAALLSSNACFAQKDEGAEAPAMDERDAYEVLGVNKRSTEAEIRKSFKEKSLILHPDKEEGSEQAFAELRRAYETLIDPERRIVLDELDGKGFDHPSEFEVLGEDMELSDFYAESRQIVKFSNENILSLLWRKQAWVVEFYVPWCTYCQSMAPKWKLLTTKYASHEYVRFGAVNCMKQTAMCDRYPFTLVPTFMCFHSDKDYHVYEGIPDEEKIDKFIQKCEDDFKEHLNNGDEVFDKFMESGGAREVDLDADEYDYDLTSGDDDDDGGEEIGGVASEAETEPPAKDSDEAEEEEEEEEEDEFDYELVSDDESEEEADQVDDVDGGDVGVEEEEDEEEDWVDEDYEYELVSDEGGDGQQQKQQEQQEEEEEEEGKGSEKASAANSDLEEENKKLKEELDAIKQRMEGMEDMIAKMKTLFAT